LHGVLRMMLQHLGLPEQPTSQQCRNNSNSFQAAMRMALS
jgi:hypothetical protein